MNGSILHKLLDKEMDRTTFLVTIASLGLGVFGVTRLLSQIEDVTKTPTHPSTTTSSIGGSKKSAYGSSPYGV